MSSSTVSKRSTKVKVASASIDFNNALSKYYKLKHDYQKSINKQVKELYNNDSLTNQEKHKKFLETKKNVLNVVKLVGVYSLKLAIF